MRVLQISSSGMKFFKEQIRILERQGIECDVVDYEPGSLSENKHTDGDGLTSKLLNEIYGHNPLYYAYRAADFYPRILKTAMQNEYDLVHLNSGMIAPLGLLQPERPIVLTLWGDDLIGDRLYGYQPAITRFCARRSSSVIVRSEEMEEALPCEAHVIPSGVDMSKFAPMDREETRRRLGWSREDRHVLFPYPPAQTKKRYPIAQQLVERADDALDENVNLQVVKDVPHERMPLYYNAADALLVPSLREGSPNTVKEAMACNLPVVSTDVGDARERLEPVSNSHVCSDDSELEDALVSVLETGGRSDGREHVEALSLKRMGERLTSIYESVLEEHDT